MKFLLSNNFILRKKTDGRNVMYDKSHSISYYITDKLFTFLYFFKENSVDLDSILSFFEKNKITIDDIQAFLSRPDMKNLLIASHQTTDTNISKAYNIYHNPYKASEFTEYTPERIDFLITKKCNLKCKHCFELSSPQEKTRMFNMETLRRVFQQMDNLNVKTLKITGGEPFVHSQFQDILEEVSKSRFETIILTNGLLIKEDTMKLIKSSNIKLGISLDGITSNTHDYLRGKGAFDVLYKKLKRLGEFGIDLTLTFTANKYNEHELEQLVSTAFSEIGVRCVFVNRLRPIGRAINSDDLFIPNDEYQLLQKRIDELVIKYGKDKIVLSDDSLPMAKSNNEQLTENTPLVCAAGNSVLCIDDVFDVYPCIYGQGKKDYVIGNLAEETLLNIWQSEKLRPYRGGTTLTQIKDCKLCHKREQCGIKNCRLKPVYNGLGFYEHVPYCCES